MIDQPDFFYPLGMESRGELKILLYQENHRGENRSGSNISSNKNFLTEIRVLNQKELIELIKMTGLEEYADYMGKNIMTQISNNIERIPKIMAIANATPDSFFESSRISSSTISRIIEFKPDIIDVGGESTRPHSVEIDSKTEISRLENVMETLKNNYDGIVSLDTRHPEVADHFKDRIDIINDVSGLYNGEMIKIAAEEKLQYVLMHIKGEVNKMLQNAKYDDLPGEMAKFFFSRLKKMMDMGMPCNRIIIDPGLGFSKTHDHDYFLVKNPNVYSLGFPRLVGHSRKRFLGYVTGVEAERRLPETLATSLFLKQKGIEILRVHDPDENIRFLKQFRFLSQA